MDDQRWDLINTLALGLLAVLNAVLGWAAKVYNDRIKRIEETLSQTRGVAFVTDKEVAVETARATERIKAAANEREAIKAEVVGLKTTMTAQHEALRQEVEALKGGFREVKGAVETISEYIKRNGGSNGGRKVG